jgi:hypothetical protein
LRILLSSQDETLFRLNGEARGGLPLGRDSVKKIVCVLVSLTCCACGGNVIQKVKYDFGIGQKPEGYEAPSERVMSQLDGVGKSELKRMNVENRHGEVKFQEDGPYKGKYFKEVKKYEKHHPVEAKAVSRAAQGDRGYVGYVEYTYQMYQSERKSTRTEAAAASATIPTHETGRETYRYRFSSGGAWNSSKGERVGK